MVLHPMHSICALLKTQQVNTCVQNLAGLYINDQMVKLQEHENSDNYSSTETVLKKVNKIVHAYVRFVPKALTNYQMGITFSIFFI